MKRAKEMKRAKAKVMADEGGFENATGSYTSLTVIGQEAP